MINLPGYRILEKVIEEASWSMYRAYSIEDDKIIAIKTANNKNNILQNAAEIIHDYHITKGLTNAGVLQPKKLEKHGNHAYIVTELFTGITLSEWLQKEKPNLFTVINVLARIATIISVIHQEHIIHKSLQPQNILINPKTNEIKITGFNQATKLSIETEQPHVSPYQLTVQAAYISPEQTGRMNRSLDYRTDLYSLGVIFYEMVTGSLPFQLENPAEVIHAHLAEVPKRPQEMNRSIPEMISMMIMKLLEKAPESRYQSAYGLKEDLEKCYYSLKQNREIRPFDLAEKDVAVLLDRPHKLYGRDDAVSQLLDGFRRVREDGLELLLIPGPSGIGKTVLVNELHKPIVREKGYFISGKFGQVQTQKPYAPLVQSFQSLLRQILSEGSDSIQKWRDDLRVELASFAGVIANFIPEVQWFIESQTEVIDLPPQGIHNRFRQAVRKFVHVFAKAEHPLILFIDDLQWADPATLDLIQHLLSDESNQHLLIIGAYRENEISVGHPFEIMLNNIKEKDIRITKIPMNPLKFVHITEWIGRTFSLKPKDADAIGEIVYRITQGNPFYVTQLLQSFYDEKTIVFQQEIGKWQINFAALKQFTVTDTIIDFIVKRMDRLPGETKEILQLASCFGNQFDLKSLSAIAGQSYAEVAEKLWDGLEEGVILPLDASYKWVYPNENISMLDEYPPTYRFLHDRVQQAFYVTMSEDKRKTYHLQIGTELLEYYNEIERETHIFEIVNHLNICRDRLTDEQKNNLIQWNCLAGSQAKARAASKAALSYFMVGRELLPVDSWDSQYEATFTTLIGLGEAQYLNHQFEPAEEIFNEILANAKTPQEKLQVYNLKIMLYIHIHAVEEATRSGLDGVRLFQWNIKGAPKKWDVALEYMLTKWALRKNKKVNLLQLPEVMEENPKLIMRTLINTNAPAYHANQNLATILMLRALRLTLKYGDMDVTALVYNNYALMLSAGFRDYEGSYRFGKLAIEHVNKYQDTSLKARVYFVFGSFVNHWKEHIRYNLNYLEQSQQLCIESGNLHLAGANCSFIGLILFIIGDNLGSVKEGIERQLTFARQNEYVLSDDFLGETMDWIEVLSNPKADLKWDFTSFTDDPSAKIIHYTLRLQMTYLLQNELEALAIMEELETLVDDTLILVIAPDYYFYHSLWLTKLMQKGSISLRDGRRKLRKKLAKLKEWANSSPTNYMHKYLLVKAELKRITKHHNETIHLYHQSIMLAEENGYLQDTAIANQCAGEYYLEQSLPKSARSYLADAYLFYMKWGANHLAYLLYQKYSAFIDDEEHVAATGQLANESLDLHTVFQAASVLSEEVVFDQLVTKMMNVMLTNAGAEHAYLIVNTDDCLQLVASNHMNRTIQVYQSPKKLSRQDNLAVSIVDYVVTSHETVVLEDASEKGEFTHDSYIKTNKIKSILCLPILYQGHLTGILYLENNQSTHAFTKEQIDLLTLLAAQAAISIENAYVYSQLEAKVQERTNLLNEANKNLTTVNQSLEQSEEARRQLLANISHDLRSPIASVRGYVDAILDDVVKHPDQQRHYLEIVKTRLTSLNRLVQDLFELAQLELGSSTFSMDFIPIDQLFTRLCSQFEMEVKQEDLHFEWSLPALVGEEYPLVEVDVGRIEQVLTNLVTNAIKHTSKGTIRITLLLEKMERVIIAITDDGSGIRKSEIPYIFDRFYTKKGKSDKQGHGLGLTISKEIMTQHKGEIWIESEEGIGTTTFISLPTFTFVAG